jgi:hypothetical protein
MRRSILSVDNPVHYFPSLCVSCSLVALEFYWHCLCLPRRMHWQSAVHASLLPAPSITSVSHYCCPPSTPLAIVSYYRSPCHAEVLLILNGSIIIGNPCNIPGARVKCMIRRRRNPNRASQDSALNKHPGAYYTLFQQRKSLRERMDSMPNAQSLQPRSRVRAELSSKVAPRPTRLPRQRIVTRLQVCSCVSVVRSGEILGTPTGFGDNG